MQPTRYPAGPQYTPHAGPQQTPVEAQVHQLTGQENNIHLVIHNPNSSLAPTVIPVRSMQAQPLANDPLRGYRPAPIAVVPDRTLHAAPVMRAAPSARAPHIDSPRPPPHHPHTGIVAQPANPANPAAAAAQQRQLPHFRPY